MKAACAICAAEFDKRRTTKTCGDECAKELRRRRNRNKVRRWYAAHPEKRREHAKRYAAAKAEKAREAGRPKATYKYDDRDKDVLRELLQDSGPMKQVCRRFSLITGKAIGLSTASFYAQAFGIDRNAPTPCDLCEKPDKPGIHRGQPWDLEGFICTGCRDELKAETVLNQRMAKSAAAEAKRRSREANRRTAVVGKAPAEANAPPRVLREEADRADAPNRAARAATIRLLHMPLPVLDPFFTEADLNRRAASHVLAKSHLDGSAPRLMREFHDGLFSCLRRQRPATA
jgi:hypothetical protein